MKKITYLITILMFFSIEGCKEKNKDPYAACTELDELDAELLQIMDRVKQKHAGNKKFLRAFEMEQVYWIQYRDRRLRAMYPEDWNTFYRKKYGKDVFNPCKCKELVRLEKKRIKDLAMYLEGGPGDQEDCPSMMNTK